MNNIFIDYMSKSEGGFFQRHWKKLAAGAAAIGITAGAVDLSRSGKHEQANKDAQAERLKADELNRQDRDMRALEDARRLQAEEVARERDQEQIGKVKSAIDAMFNQKADSEVGDDSEPGPLDQMAVTEKLEQLAKASKLKDFLEKSVAGLKIKMSQDGSSLLTAFPDAQGNVDRDQIVSIDLTGTGMIRIDSVSNFDAPVDIPVDPNADLSQVADVVKKKFLIMQEDTQLMHGRAVYDEATEQALKNFIQQQGLQIT